MFNRRAVFIFTRQLRLAEKKLLLLDTLESSIWFVLVLIIFLDDKAVSLAGA